MIVRFFTASLSLMLVTQAFAWGPQGHRTIAALALEQVAKSKPEAAAKIKEILAGEDVRDAAIWPDDVRPNRIASRAGRFSATEEGKKFNEAHPDNPMWHFVDLPLASKAYGSDKRFIAENDVVATIVRCVDVLEGRSDFMSKHDALRFLLHMSGDVHQPLHVAVGFFKFDAEGRATLITDPDEAAATPDGKDNGGNKLMLEKNLPLHKYWDENLVALVAEGEDALAAKLRPQLEAAKPVATGIARDLPAQWATDAIGVSREMYGELKFGKRFPRTGSYWTVYLNFKTGTKEKFTAMTEKQLVKASRDLAEMLGAIQWK